MAKKEKKPLPDPKGFICIWRCVEDHWIFTDSPPEYFKAWVSILMNVQHKNEEKEIYIRGDKYIVKRGESIKSLDTWAQKFGKGWNKSKVRRFFKLLEKSGLIETRGSTKTTHLSVCKYDTWQPSENGFETIPDENVTHKRNESETKTTPDNNDIKKEGKKKEEELKQQFDDFRKEYPGTKRGLQSELDDFKRKHQDYKEIIPRLADALKYQKQVRSSLESQGAFVAQWKNLKTWLYNRCWEEETQIPESDQNLSPAERAFNEHKRNSGLTV